jgi:hypothetical protein
LVGATLGAIVYFKGGNPTASVVCISIVLGLIAGLEVLAFGFTAGTAGILAAMGSGGRIAVMLRALLYETAALACNCALLVLALVPAPVLPPLALLLLICKWLFFNWRCGSAIIDRSARLMDGVLLGGD